MALSSDAALKNPLKGLMLSGMQLLLNAREEELGVEFKIVTKILNREFGISDAFLYSALCPALPSRRNLAYRHTSSSDLNSGSNRTIQTDGTHPEERCRNSCGEKGAAQGSAGPRDWQEKRELTARES
jgi:hypothetical protein